MTDQVAIDAFVDALFAGQPPDTWLSAWSPGSCRWATDTAGIATAIAELGATGDAYVCPSTQRECGTPYERAQAARASTVGALWLDFDILGPGHKQTRLPPSLEVALYFVTSTAPIAPSIIVHSGGGLQPWWLLDHQVEVEVATTMIEGLKTFWRAKADEHGWVVDAVFDLARVMRVPGTFNCKVEPWRPVVAIEADYQLRYTIEDITRAFPPAPIEPRRQRIPLTGTEGPFDELPGDAFNRRRTCGDVLGDLGWTMVGRTTKGDKWRHPDASYPHSAIVYDDIGKCQIFTSHFLPVIDPDDKAEYDPYGLYTRLVHAGDFQRSRETLEQAGYGNRRQTTNGTKPVTITGVIPVEIESDWTPTDLAEIAVAMRSGAYQPIEPTVLKVTGSSPLFYPGRINSVFGESGGGKTWVALAAAAACVRAGRHVLFIDYEDTPAGTTERLINLGLTDAQIALIDYVNPATALALGITELPALTGGHEYAMVAVDSTGESMAAGGVDPNDDAKVAMWFRLVRALTRLPGEPAVIVLDHIPKDKDAPANYAIGSQRKRAAVSGAAYRVDTLKEPAKGRDGKLKLTVAKDRPGNRAKGTTAAVIDLIAGPQGEVTIELHLSDAQKAEQTGEPWRPTIYMERVSRWLELNPGAPKRDLIDGVPGKRDVIEAALIRLLEEGYCEMTMGEKNAKKHTMLRPFREIEDTPRPVDNDSKDDTDPLVRTGVNRCEPGVNPEAGCTPGTLVRTPPSPPKGGTHQTGARQEDQNLALEPSGAHQTPPSVSAVETADQTILDLTDDPIFGTPKETP